MLGEQIYTLGDFRRLTAALPDDVNLTLELDEGDSEPRVELRELYPEERRPGLYPIKVVITP